MKILARCFEEMLNGDRAMEEQWGKWLERI